MEVEVHEIGHSKSTVVVIDDFLTNAQDAVDMAAALPAFPPESKTGYPGRRHQIGPGDKASRCVLEILTAAGPVIQSHYDADNYRVFEASFSLVTTPPQDRSPRQSIPHYDWDDPNYLAILLHLHRVPDTGTAFYRHIASDFEQVTHDTAAQYRTLVQAELAGHDAVQAGAGGQSSANYEQIFQVEGRYNRLVVYQGCLIHSGYFSPDFNYSDDPRTGRLTANIFIQTAKRTS
ncbi:MAG: histone acetyltransferase [Asticcacaulis sp.]|nr:histone acetyltransferase [Asticcacaulis sp.]